MLARTGCTVPAAHALPKWLEQNQYRSPTEGRNCPFSLGFKTDLHFFEFLNANPEYPAPATQFNNLMSAYHQGRPSWMDVGFYLVHDKLIQGARSGDDEVFLVDVGGNKGHDLEEFTSKRPYYPGRLILEDLPHVLDDITSLNPSIEPTAHDFFTEQPVKGGAHIHCSPRCVPKKADHWFRSASIFPALHPPRLERRDMPEDSFADCGRHGTWVQSTAYQREHHPEYRGALAGHFAGYRNDGGSRRKRTD